MIDFKPAVRFLKLDKMGEKCAEVGKNIAAFAKHHPIWASLYVGTIAAGATVCPPSTQLDFGIIMTGIAACFFNVEGKYDCQRDEIVAARSNTPSQLSL